MIARCQLPKLRNVRDHLPKNMRGPVATRMRQAYHPEAAGGLREGLAETLTVLRLDVPPTPARALRSTNQVESTISIIRDHARNVTRRRDGQMAMRWRAAGMVEASKQFRGWTATSTCLPSGPRWNSAVSTETFRPHGNTQDASAG